MTPPTYGDVTTHEELVAWARAYAREVRREWGVDVRLDLVEWEVSTRAKRRAGALKHPKITETTVGIPLDWDRAETADGRRADGRPFPATVSLTWGAFEAFDRDAFASIVRHELLHLEQYQHSGTTNHGTAFKSRAADLDTEVRCQTFTEPAYVLRCADCEGLVARRYRDCKLVRRADEYRSSCCGAALVLE